MLRLDRSSRANADDSSGRDLRPAAEVNKWGQILGRKGRRTQARIVAGLKLLLASAPIAGITVIAVAAEADVSGPTFYSYFDDLGEVLLAALQEVEPDLAAVRHTLEIDWPREQAFTHAELFIEAYRDLWMKHAPVLQARNALAELRDERFMAHRVTGPNELAHMLAAKMHPIHRADTPRPVEPLGMASIVITALERLSTHLANAYHEPDAINWKRSRHALAHFIVEGIRPL